MSNVAAKERLVTKSKKPWVQKAIQRGREVPTWIAVLKSEREFFAMLKLRENAFPATRRKKLK